MACPEDDQPRVATAKVRLRATLLATWSVTPDTAFREAIERELYGEPAPERAAEEWERLRVVSDSRADHGVEPSP